MVGANLRKPALSKSTLSHALGEHRVAGIWCPDRTVIFAPWAKRRGFGSAMDCTSRRNGTDQLFKAISCRATAVLCKSVSLRMAIGTHRFGPAPTLVLSICLLHWSLATQSTLRFMVIGYLATLRCRQRSQQRLTPSRTLHSRPARHRCRRVNGLGVPEAATASMID